MRHCRAIIRNGRACSQSYAILIHTQQGAQAWRSLQGLPAPPPSLAGQAARPAPGARSRKRSGCGGRGGRGILLRGPDELEWDSRSSHVRLQAPFDIDKISCKCQPKQHHENADEIDDEAGWLEFIGFEKCSRPPIADRKSVV